MSQRHEENSVEQENYQGTANLMNATYPHLLLFDEEVLDVLLLLLDLVLVVSKVAHDEPATPAGAQRSALLRETFARTTGTVRLIYTHFFSRAFCANSSLTLRNSVTENSAYSSSWASFLSGPIIVSCALLGEQRRLKATHVDDRGTTICVSRSYELSHSLIKFLCDRT